MFNKSLVYVGMIMMGVFALYGCCCSISSCEGPIGFKTCP